MRRLRVPRFLDDWPGQIPLPGHRAEIAECGRWRWIYHCQCGKVFRVESLEHIEALHHDHRLYHDVPVLVTEFDEDPGVPL